MTPKDEQWLVELRTKICRAVNIFPDELDERLPNTFGRQELDRLEEVFLAELKKREAEHEQAMGKVIDERDNAEEWADNLAYAVSRTFSIDVGEHSNVNNPWHNAHDYLQDFPMYMRFDHKPAHPKPNNS